jgi:phosphoenolpyruvate synthase/pyruvate phosphate dikinase
MGDETLRASYCIPESFFLGSDVTYIFMAMNGLMYWNDQKYKPENQIWDEYPQIKLDFEAGKFPPEILSELKELLEKVGNKPLIVRSSSLLEDNFGTAFAGKYDSYFCPNQGTSSENLNALTLAIARTFASTLKPEALLYRRSKGLQDYEERMAILIQVVEGETYGDITYLMGWGSFQSQPISVEPTNPPGGRFCAIGLGFRYPGCGTSGQRLPTSGST